jgi:LPS-assembly lipoprotein
VRRRSLLLAAPLAGCGFAPRGAPSFAFERLALVGFAPRSPMREALVRQLSRLPLRLTDRAQAQVVFELERELHDKSAVASTAAGQVREWQLLLELEYRLTTPSDELLLPRTELRLTRDLSTTEAQALAKEQEEALLRRAMEQEAVGLLMRRLAAVRPR